MRLFLFLSRLAQKVNRHLFFGLPVLYGSRAQLCDFFGKHGEGKVFVGLHVGSFPGIYKGSFPRPEGIKNVFFYPDGISTLLVLRRNRCKGVERLPTTDVGWNLLEYKRPLQPTLGIVGAEEMVNQKAKSIFLNKGFDVLWNFNGFSELEESLDQELPSPDCIVVGLGMPLEMEHGLKLLELHPNSRILTCGGWLNFIAGIEKRSPKWMQKVGLEWLWRFSMNPKRLFQRYFMGALYTTKMIIKRQSGDNL